MDNNMPVHTLKEWKEKAFKEVHGYQVHDILRDWETNIKHILSAEGYEQRIEQLEKAFTHACGELGMGAIDLNTEIERFVQCAEDLEGK